MSTRRATLVAGVAGIVLVSRLLGMLREMLIADRFGTNAEYDLYLVAVMLPALAYGVLNYTFYYLLVPYLTRLFESKQPLENRARLLWTALNGSLLTGAAVAIVLLLVSPLVMQIWSGEFDNSQFGTVMFYARLMTVIVVLGVLEAVLRALLNARGIFTAPAAGWVLFNLAFITLLWLTAPNLGIGALALAHIGGLVAQNLLLWIGSLSKRALPAFVRSFDTVEWKALCASAAAIFLVELLNRSYFLIDRYFALEFGDGIVAALNYSQVLVQLPDSIVGFAIASVAYPLFARNNSAENAKSFIGTYRTAIMASLLVAIPLAVFVYVNAEPIIRVLFLRGKFNLESLRLTADVLRPHTPTIIALFVISTSIRACYARSLARYVLMFSAFLMFVKWIATWAAAHSVGYTGITAATSWVFVSFAVLLSTIILSQQAGELRSAMWQVARLLFAGFGALAVHGLVTGMISEVVTSQTVVGDILYLVLSGMVILAVFLVVVYVSGLSSLIRVVVKR